MKNLEFALLAATQPSLSEEQAFNAIMARTLTGSLGIDEAIRCATRHNWVGLLPLVMVETDAICLEDYTPARGYNTKEH